MSTSQEIADALGVSKRAAELRALRESWPYEERACRGGRKRFYRVESLPAPVRAALIAAMAYPPPPPHEASSQDLASQLSVAELPAPPPPTQSAVQIGMLMGGVLEHPDALDAKAAAAHERWAALQPLLALPPRHRGRRALAADIGRRLGLSVGQVYRLEAAARTSGVQGLIKTPRADRGRQRTLISGSFERLLRGFGRTDAEITALADEIAGQVKSAWAAGAPSERQCWLGVIGELSARLMARGWPKEQVRALALLNPSTLRRFLAGYKEYRLVATLKRDAKRAYAEYQPAVVRSWAHLAPGELVFGDVSPIDIPVLRPDGSTAYLRMIAWLDGASAWMFITLHLCPKGTGITREHVARSFAELCASAPFGMPLKLYLDNGSEYKWVDMLGAWQGLARLTGQRIHVDIGAMDDERGRLIRSIPFRPRGKIIESRFSTLRHWFGWHPSWQGGDRLAKRAAALGRLPQAVPYEDATAFIAGVMADYHASPQGKGTHLDGRSPMAIIDAALDAGWRPARVDREALLLAFSDEERRQVRGGKISFRGQLWYDDCLVGRDGWVRVRYPRMEGHRGAAFILDDSTGRFLGCALPETLYRGDDPAGALEAARRGRQLRLVAGKLAGEVTAFEHQPGAIGALLGVDETIERARDAAQRIELSDEARALIAAKIAAEARTEALYREMAARQDASTLRRMAIEDDPETAAARALFG